MAYFPNGTSGMCFDEQCANCRFGEQSCPVYWVQLHYNYDACNNEVASAILNDLVKDDGTCAMFQMDPQCFRSDWSKQESLPLDDAITASESLKERSTRSAEEWLRLQSLADRLAAIEKNLPHLLDPSLSQ